MDTKSFPTKGNLIAAKNSLQLARQGYELMDKKRNILMRELMELIGQASEIQSRIDQTFRSAYGALQRANIELGISHVEEISYSVPVEGKASASRPEVLWERKFPWRSTTDSRWFPPTPSTRPSSLWTRPGLLLIM